MKLKPLCATLAFATLGLVMAPVTSHAFGLGDIVNTVTGNKSPSQANNYGRTKVKIVSSPYAHIYTSQKKLAPSGDVRGDDDFTKFGMTDGNGVFDQDIPSNTKCIVVLKSVNNHRNVVTKTFQYTGQKTINAKF